MAKPPPPNPDDVFWYKRKPAIARAGMMGLTLEAKAVYGILIDLCYERRGPLEDNDKTLAHACEIDVRKYRRIKTELIDADRIIIDAEAGTLYDARVIRELVKDGLLSETQSKRARKKPRANVVNLRVVAKDEPVIHREIGPSSTPSYPPSSLGITTPVSNEINHLTPASRVEKRRYNPPAAPTPAKQRRDPRAGSPLTGASAPPAQREDRSTWSPEKIRAWKEAQLAGLAASDPEALAKAHELGQSPIGDRKARRTNG